MQHKPLHIAKRSCEQVDFYNQLYKNWPLIGIDNLGYISISNFLHAFRNVWKNEDLLFRLKIGDVSFYIKIKLGFWQFLLEKQSLENRSDDPFLQKMVVAAAFEPFIEKLNFLPNFEAIECYEVNQTRSLPDFGNIGCLFIESITAADVSADDADTSQTAARQWPIEIYFDFAASQLVYDLCKSKNSLRVLPNITKKFPIIIGNQRIDISAFNAIGEGDFLLFSRACKSINDATIKLSKTIAYRLKLKADQMVVEERINMNEFEKQSDEMRASDIEFKADLDFDVGSIEINVNDLAQIGNGYIFELGQKLEDGINIRVNGRLVGKGELLSINDHIGVQITDWHV